MAELPGTFTLSLDTELAWGRFDTTAVERLSEQFRATRTVVTDLLELFERYDVSATWALVTHLLKDCRPDPAESHAAQARPTFEWVNWFERLPCVREVDTDLWYWPELLDLLENSNPSQEVGLHGHTHMILGADGCDRNAATDELAAATQFARERGIDPVSFVYPRNSIGHCDILAEHGIEVIRGRDARWYERAPLPESLRRPFRFADEASLWTPPTVTPKQVDRLVEIPGSQLYRPYHGGWEYTPETSQVTRAIEGLNRAAERGEIYHLWFHPSNLACDPDRLLSGLDNILSHAARLRDAGKLEIQTMADVAEDYREGRWES